ncbi:MAG TPA: glycoside hydrolase family 15 protein, partial [Acidobacteriaceae bacterium]
QAIASAEFTILAGQHRSFVLTYAAAEEAPPRRVNVKTAFRDTEQFWREWTGKSKYSGGWKEAVERSLITLKALTYRPSGGIIAAPTTSLPEHFGIDRNWDYRYCWLRDGAFTLESLLSVGYHDEAKAWQQWLLQSVGSDVRQTQIMYGMRGERHLPEYELPWLRGYRSSGPVRVGNAASQQQQLDVFGEVADAISTMAAAKMRLDPRIGEFQIRLTDYVARICARPTSGIWERRSVRRQYTYSKVMAWLALKLGVAAVEAGRVQGPLAHWRRARNALHREICEHGFSRQLNCFVQSYHSRLLDSSSLLIPIFGFLPFGDERVTGTLRAIEKHLVRDELVYRLQPRSPKECEAAFLPCSFWLVQSHALAGQISEAEKRFEMLLRLRNDVGLLAEEYNPGEGRFQGNFPQALSHIALINAARALERYG